MTLPERQLAVGIDVLIDGREVVLSFHHPALHVHALG